MRQRLGEDAKQSFFNMTKVKIYIPGVTRERARELVLQHMEHDPSLESLRELYESMNRILQNLSLISSL